MRDVSKRLTEAPFWNRCCEATTLILVLVRGYSTEVAVPRGNPQLTEPAVFVLIRDGRKRYYADRWASVFLFREILWGAQELQRRLTAGEETGEWTDDASGDDSRDVNRRYMV